MKHLGDITKINGAEIPVVDVITGGSPCQDLSVAGKRAGLAGERSGLFMEQIRLIKEMRERDRAAGRTDDMVRPRYMVWENVPGAFSSNGGEDFRAVIEEIVKVSVPDAPSVPMPEKGRWSKAGCVYDELGQWSVAWKVHDSQYHGVPQRRKRVSLLADFNGLTAPAIMFDPQLERTTEEGYPYEAQSDSGAESRSEVQSVGEGVSRNPEPCGEAGQEAAGSLGAGFKSAGGCLNPWDIQSKRVIDSDGTADALYSGERRYGGGEAYVLDKPETVCLEGNGQRESHFGDGYSESDVMYTLNTIERHGVLPVAVDVYNQTIEGEVSPTITAAAGGTNTSGPKIMSASGVVAKGNGDAFLMDEKSTSLSTGGGMAGQGYPAAMVSEEPIVLESNQNHATVTDDGVSPCLPAAMGMGGGYVPMVTECHAISFQKRAGKPGGGKGILIQDEHIGALSTLDIQRVLSLETYHCESETDTAMTLKARDYKDPQSVYCVPGDSGMKEPIAYGICSFESNSMKSGNPDSGIYEAETSRTLDLNGGSPTCNQGGMMVVQPTMCLNDQGGQQMGVSYDVTSTLRAEDHQHPPLVMRDAAGFSFGQSSKARSLGYQKEVSPTLRGGEGGNQKPCVLDIRQAVPVENHPNDSRVKLAEDGVFQALTSRMGTGGNNTPLVMESVLPFDTTQVTCPDNFSNPRPGDPCHPLAATAHPPAVAYGIDQQGGKGGANYSEDVCPPILSDSHGTPHAVAYQSEEKTTVDDSRTATCIGNGQADIASHISEEVCQTLNCMHDQLAVCVGNGQTKNISMAEIANGLDTLHDQQAILTDIAAVDCRNATENPDVNGTLQAKEQGQNLNSNNVCRTANTVRRLTPKECERLQAFPDDWTNIGDWVDSKGKLHKGDADSPRYKALGNSIALPFWDWLLGRISAQYDRPATLGSLFDGIGGFPLCWEKHNGKGTALWASEIEEFPIAVTKIHFPEDKDDAD